MSIPTHYILSITNVRYDNHLCGMDASWFKQRHREVGITQAELAALMGKAPTFLTRIYNGTQELRLAEAKKIASALRAPLSDVLVRAGVAQGVDTEVQTLDRPSFSQPPPQNDLVPSDAFAPTLEPRSNSQHAWTVQSTQLCDAGYQMGDHIVVDVNVKPAPGDVVVAHIHDWKSGTSQTALRIFEPPYLLTAHPGSHREKPVMIDNERVYVSGVVVLSWRSRSAA